MTSNPLRVLGIASEALKHTTLDQATRLVESMSKERLRQEHPDAGGDAVRFQAVREATVKLRDKEQLRQALQDLQQPQRTKVAKLEQKLRQSETARYRAEQRAEAFMSGAAGASSDTTIYHPELTLRLRDVLRSQQIHNTPRTHTNQLFVSLTTAYGQITTSQRGDQQKQRRNRLIGCLHQDDVPSDFTQAIDFVLACHPSTAQPALSGSGMYHPRPRALTQGNFLSWNQAEPIRRLLRPELRLNAILFSYRLGEEPGLLVEGQLLEAKTANPP